MGMPRELLFRPDPRIEWVCMMNGKILFHSIIEDCAKGFRSREGDRRIKVVNVDEYLRDAKSI